MPFAITPRRTAAALLVLAVAGAAAAQAASAPTPQAAAGTAGSEVTLLDLSVAGHPISVGRLSLGSAIGSGTATVTGLIADGTSYGERNITTGSLSAPSLTTAGVLPAGLVSVTSPAASLSAGSGFARAGADSLGTISVLGLPLSLDGTIETAAGVDGTHAAAQKTLVVRNLALPSIGGVLGSLGLDLTKLSPDTLLTLVQKLGLVTTPITDAKKTLDAALAPLQPQITAAQQQVAAAQAAVAAANDKVTATTASLTTATSTLDSATQQLQAALGTPPHLMRTSALSLPSVPSVPTVPTVPAVTVPTVPTVPAGTVPTVPTVPTVTSTVPTVAGPTVPTVPGVPSVPAAIPSVPVALPTPLPTNLPSILPSALPIPSLPAVIPVSTQPLVDTYNTAKSAYDVALAQVNAATGALNTANGLLNTVTSTLNTLLSSVDAQTSALVKAVTDVLGATPLVSIDSFTVRTEATATSAAKGDQTARVVGGELQGVHVLGTDVLSTALHTSRIDLGQLAGQPMALLNSTIAQVTGQLASVLSAVPGLSVPAPTVELLSSTTSTDVDGDFGTARNIVHALKLTIPALTIPTALQKPVSGLAIKSVGELLTQPLSIAVGTMTDTVSFRPAVAGNTGVVPPTQTVGSTTGTTPTASVPVASTPSDTTPSVSTPTDTVPTDSAPNAVPTAAGPQQLPRTGLGEGAGLLALGLCGAGMFLCRRNAVV